MCLPCDTAADHPRFTLPTPLGTPKQLCQVCGALTDWEWGARRPFASVVHG